MFDLTTTPWIIYIKSETQFYAAEEWLKTNFGKSLGMSYYDYMIGLTNTDCYGDVHNKVMYLAKGSDDSANRFEIKMTYQTTTEIVNVEYTEIKSESEKQLDNVMAKLAELQKEAEQLQETIKKEKK